MPATEARSKRRLGKRFWLVAVRPGKNSMVVARVLGSRRSPVRSSTSALGSSDPADRISRGRWYLKLRPTRRTPFASKAEARVSPAIAFVARPSKVKGRAVVRSISPPVGRRVMGEGGESKTLPPLEGGRGGVRTVEDSGCTHLSPTPSRKGRGCLLPLPIPRPLLLLLPTMVWLMPAPRCFGPQHLVRPGIARHHQPGAAAMHVLPILAMHPRNVISQIHIVVPRVAALSLSGRGGAAPPR